MKIAFLGAVPFNLIFGGGEVQLLKTMEALRELGIDVVFWENFDKNFKCDILHIFGCHYWLFHAANLAKLKGIKIAISPISYVPSIKFYYKIWKYLDKFVPVDTTYRLHRKLLSVADVILPNSLAEAHYLTTNFNIEPDKIFIVPNAAEERFAYASPDLFYKEYKLKNFVLCVGKIEPRKNQLLLVKALTNSEKNLVLIGDPIPNRMDYFEKVMKIVKSNSNMHYIKSLPHDSNLLASAYAAAKVHVLLGVNETPGIVNLEAGLAGANLVVADCPPVREYLKDFAIYCNFLSLQDDFAIYCNSLSLQDVRRAINEGYNKKKDDRLKNFIMSNYNWEIVARRTLQAYKKILSKR